MVPVLACLTCHFGKAADFYRGAAFGAVSGADVAAKSLSTLAAGGLLTHICSDHVYLGKNRGSFELLLNC